MAQQQQLGDRHNQQQQLGDRHKQHQRHALAHASTHASTHACSHAHRTHLNDLPDSCLLHVFKHLFPAPDKFSVAATCWRFYRLVSDRRLWLKVSPTGVVPESAPGGAGPVYTTLQAAVQASRYGVCVCVCVSGLLLFQPHICMHTWTLIPNAHHITCSIYS